MGEPAGWLHRVCIGVALAVVAAMLTGCEDVFEVSGSFTCTDTTIASSNTSCKAWKQEGTTKNDGDEFILTIEYKCIETSAQTGQCLRWSQSGSVKKENGGGCFPQDAVVVTRAGPRVMSQVRIGDELLGFDHVTDTIGFSTVRAWLHRDMNAESLMVVLQTEDGEVASSPKHSLAVVWAGGHKKYVFASEVQVGDLLFARDGKHVEVTGVRAEAAVGLYSPLTGYSNFFAGRVNGSAVLAHSFAHLRHPRWFETPVHAMISASELFSSTVVSSAEDDNAKYIHPWLRAVAALAGVNLEQGAQMWDLGDGGLFRRLKGGRGAVQQEDDSKEEMLLVKQMMASLPLLAA